MKGDRYNWKGEWCALNFDLGIILNENKYEFPLFDIIFT